MTRISQQIDIARCLNCIILMENKAIWVQVFINLIGKSLGKFSNQNFVFFHEQHHR